MNNRAVRAEHYRSKAEEVRVIGESLKDADAKRILMNVAGDYLMLAEMLQRSAMDDPLTARR
ncbi:MAG TPA: hypothetical protein VKR31_09455 [Rhizomicrobium sp.]|nr:hypothetical protein [Rhizomicrobium sp.]